MTIPDERYGAVESTREFLRSLLDKSKTPRVPLEIRRQARTRLKHFPDDYHMELTRKKCPEIWGKKIKKRVI